MNLVQKFGTLTLGALAIAQVSIAATHYFLIEVPNPTLSVVDVTNDDGHVMGKSSNATLSITTGYTSTGGYTRPRCGSYQNGSDPEQDITTSSVFTSSLNEGFGMFLSRNASKGVRLSKSMYWLGTAPSAGTKLNSIALYKEDATNDTGTCIEGGRWYKKYSCDY